MNSGANSNGCDVNGERADMKSDMECYRVTLWVEREPDILKRIDRLNAAFYRIITTPAIRLRRVVRSNYELGIMEFDCEAPASDPSIVTGEVRARIETLDKARKRTLETIPGSYGETAEADERVVGRSDRLVRSDPDSS